MSNTQKFNKKVLFISGPFSELEDYINNDLEKPKGMPGVYKRLKYFAEKGWEVHWIVEGKTDRRFKKDGINFYTYNPSFYIFKWLLNNLRLSRIIKIAFLLRFVKVFTLSLKVANEIKPDVIYGLKVAYALPSYIVARKLNAVAIFVEFGTWMYRDFISSNFLRRIIRLPFFIGSIIAFNLPFDLFIMTNDGTNGDKVFKYFKIPENKCLFLLNGVDKNPIQRTKENITYLRKKYNLPLDRKIILSVGRLVSWKRLDKVIKFFSSIKGYKYNLQLVIVGNGDQEVKLNEIVKEEELGDSVKFMGDLPHKDIFEIMALSDVYISFYDLSNLSNTMLEAISSGLPIISLNDGSLSEVVTDGYNGILINSFDEKDRVIEMLSNDEILERMSKASYEIALKKLYTWDERMEKELKIVENLIEAKRKGYGR